ncbi:hypothetical protein [uncultured Dokdonia sp.]|uniref:hypothetical protein n=1 Tax=uncultured Dokdonia sp. TaxID=575653 RepID=UPI00262D694F|nr:hypothetical protein [uncultured Dokdonia sp.]
MPFGESMITTLRSNKRKNVNDTFLKNGVTTIKDRQKGNFNHKIASPELLLKIKTEIEEKKRKRNKKLIIISVVIFILLAICLWYLKYENYI